MSRKKVIALTVCALLFVLQLFGCSVKTDPKIDTTQSMDAPRQLIFSTVNEYLELIEASELQDTDLEKYLNDNSYDMNGIRSRSDLRSLEETVAAIPFPTGENVKVSQIIIYPDYKSIIVRYVVDNVVIMTRIQMDQASADFMEEMSAETEILEAANMDVLVCVDNTEDTDKHRYRANVEGYYMQFRFSNATKDLAEEILAELQFVGISDLQ